MGQAAAYRRWGEGMLTVALCALLLGGCRTNPQRANVERNLLNEKASVSQKQATVEKYLVACPDVIELRYEDRPEFDGRYVIGPDGCITLTQYGAVRVEGRPLPEVAQVVAERVGARPDRVHVRVAEFCSRHLILVGEVVGRHRTVPYQGTETVLEVLQRVGGITPGAEPTEVYVVRSHLGDLQRPEVFHVDLQSIVLDKKHGSNIRVTPYDQIYVGETRQARIEKCVPPWFRPTYQKAWNIIPTGKKATENNYSITEWMRGLLLRLDPTVDTPDVNNQALK